jgi:tetratricopeptide (TPR) repeat protein
MRRLVELREQNERTNPGLLVLALLELADVFEKLGNNTEAEAVHRRILLLRKEQASSEEHFSFGTTQLRLARLCTERGDDQEAEAWYERALAEFDAQNKHFAELTAKTGSGLSGWLSVERVSSRSRT